MTNLIKVSGYYSFKQSEKLRKIAFQKRVTRSEILREALELWFEKQKQDKKQG